MARQAALLQEFGDIYREMVAGRVNHTLGADSPRGHGRVRKWLYQPLTYTLDRRTNMFRSALALAVGPLSRTPEAVPDLAAWIEIAWTAILILDDLLDSSSERQGYACAHLVYGRKRTLLAVSAVIGHGVASLALQVRGTLRERRRRTVLTLQCIARCARTQLPSSRRTASLSRYVEAATDVNISCRWCLLAPLCGCGDGPVGDALRKYADAIAVLGKLRNDLLDYYGGGSERVERFDDFRSRRLSFPTIVLREQPISADDRRLLEDHLAGRGTMAEESILTLFDRYRVPERCLQRIDVEVDAALGAVHELNALGAPSSLITTLERWVRIVRAVCSETVESRPYEAFGRTP